MKELRDAVLNCCEVFSHHKKELGDLSPSFWSALSDLQGIVLFASHDQILAALKKHRRTLGAPGDFGYGTPCGDALRAVYDAWSGLQPQPTSDH